MDVDEHRDGRCRSGGGDGQWQGFQGSGFFVDRGIDVNPRRPAVTAGSRRVFPVRKKVSQE
jgi:hypothetical protein